MKLPKKIFLVIFILLILFVVISPVVFAQQLGTWQFDPQVTEVGKNAERARQFIYWIFTHPPSYTVPVLAQIWSISRNVVYALFVVVIAITGIAYVLAKRSGNLGPLFGGIASPIFGLSIPTLFFRIGTLILYVTFSYIIVLGLIQSSEITSRFFIEKFQGCRLFNINFAGNPLDCARAANDPETIKLLEKNYTDFVGYKDPNVLNQESANTGLMVVRATTFTYNVMAIILIIRHVVLWFLLMLAPFLALLLPFIFIRNTGYIWIGVFFQWLFYGPLVSLFIAGLAQVWIKGIPYAFNFTRINKIDSQIFPTSINILYGGPAQILSPTNSANYIDTYIEYIVSLVMLWVALLLPWLLLRIFRDYCCDILKQNNAILMSVLDKIRGVGTPPPQPLGPLVGPQISFKLPFRQKVEEVKKVDVQRLQEISKANTNELTRSLSLSVSSLAEVARFEMNKEDNKRVIETLNRISNPYVVPQEQDRQWFTQVKKELETRAQQGDREAQQILSAAFKRPGVVSPIPVSREFTEIASREVISSVIRETSLSMEKVQEILKELPKITVENQVSVLASHLQVPQVKVQQIINSLPQHVPAGIDLTALLAEHPLIAGEVAKRTGLSEEKVREVLASFSESSLSQTDRVEKIAKETAVSTEQVKQVINVLPEVIVDVYPQIFTQAQSQTDLLSRVAYETALSPDQIKTVLEKTASLSSYTEKIKAVSEEEIISLVAQYTSVSEDKVSEVIKQSERLTNTQIEQQTNLSSEKVNEILKTTELLKSLSQETKTFSQEELISKIAQQTSLSTKEVENVLNQVDRLTISSQTTKQLSQEETISLTSQQTSITEDKVKDVLKTTELLREITASAQRLTQEDIITKISQQTSLSQEGVRQVLQSVETLTQTKQLTREQLISQISQQTSLAEDKVSEILRVSELIKSVSAEIKSLSKEEKITRIVSQTSLSSQKISEILNTYDKLSTSTQLTEQKIITKIAQQTSLVSEQVKHVLDLSKLLTQTTLETKQLSQEEIITRVAQKTSLSQAKVNEVLNAANELTSTKQLNREEIITKVSQQTGLTEEKVQQVVKTSNLLKTTVKTEKQLTHEELISQVARETNLSIEEVGQILKTTATVLPQSAPNLIVGLIDQPKVMEKLMTVTGLTKETVVNVLKNVSQLSPQKTQFEDQVDMIAEIAQLPQAKVKEILGTVSAYNLERPEKAKPTIARRPTVSVEDYEEVKNMWINHYKLSEVPLSETITDREAWLNEDIRVLTNIINLLTSLDPRDKEKGMKEVATILPFLLLGGFSEAETVIYLKAKLQAAKFVLTQLEETEKIKEAVKKEEEETLVEAPIKKEAEKPKTLEEEQKKELEFPEEGNKDEKPN